jgi:hypothetical protein
MVTANDAASAIIAIFPSIDFLSLEVGFLKPHIEKARAENLEFVQFIYHRQKTDETAICHLMPEAIESLDLYLKTVPEDAKFLWYSPSNHNVSLTNKALNDILKAMVNQASIMTTGDIKFNLLRKFTFSTLQRFGITESESRVCVGKTVSPDVLTYLINLKDTLLEKYMKSYSGLSLVRSNGNGRISNLEEAVNVFSQVLSRLVLKNMTSEDLKKLDLNAQKLLNGEPIENLKAVLEYFKKQEEDYEATARRGKEDFYKERKRHGKDTQ